MKRLFKDREFILKKPHRYYSVGRMFPIGTIAYISKVDGEHRDYMVTEDGQIITGYESMMFFEIFERVVNNRNKRDIRMRR